MLLERAKYEKSMADLCHKYIRFDGRLVIMVNWVNDLQAIDYTEDVKLVEQYLNDAITLTV